MRSTRVAFLGSGPRQDIRGKALGNGTAKASPSWWPVAAASILTRLQLEPTRDGTNHQAVHAGKYSAGAVPAMPQGQNLSLLHLSRPAQDA